MPPVVVFLPFYLGVVFFGALAVLLHLRLRRARLDGVDVGHPHALTALFVTFLVLTGICGALTIEEGLIANRWVYHYYLGIDAPAGAAGAIVLPVPADRTLLAGLHANVTAANWTYVTTLHGPGLYLAFVGSCALEASFEEFAPLDSHPDPSLAPQTGNQTEWQVWIEYLGTSQLNVNFQYGWGYVVNGAAVYIGPLTPGWGNYSMYPAP